MKWCLKFHFKSFHEKNKWNKNPGRFHSTITFFFDITVILYENQNPVIHMDHWRQFLVSLIFAFHLHWVLPPCEPTSCLSCWIYPHSSWNVFFSKKIRKKKSCWQDTVTGWPVSLLSGFPSNLLEWTRRRSGHRVRPWHSWEGDPSHFFRSECCNLIEIQLQFYGDQSPYLSSNIQSIIHTV